MAFLVDDNSLRELADVDPLQRFGVTEEFIQIELDRTAGTADGGEHRGKALETVIEIHGDALVAAEGADAAHRMADQLLHLVGGKHLGLHVEFGFELMVVDARVARSEDQHASVGGFEGERFGNSCALYAQSLRSQINGCRGYSEFLDPILETQAQKIRACFFRLHELHLHP